MLAALLSPDFDKERIALFLKSRHAGYGANLFAPAVFVYYFHGTIPDWILALFFQLHLVVLVLRIYYGKRFVESLPSLSRKSANRRLEMYMLISFASAVLWGSTGFLVLRYGSYEQILFVVSLIFILLAASVSTLSTVFHAVVIFVTPIVTLYIAAFEYFGKRTEFFGVEITFLAYYFVIIPTAYAMSSFIRDSLRKKREVTTLNAQLNRRVKEAVEEMRQKEKLLQQQTRLAQMGEMISMIAHQWRQPLSAINSAVIAIETKLRTGRYNLDDPEDREAFLAFTRERIDNVKEYVKVLSHTIDDFRNFFKPDKQIERLAVEVPVKRALHIVEASLKAKNIRLRVDLEASPTLSFYPNELMQVILNILKNCEDNFTDRQTPDPAIDILLEEHEESVTIRICDNGGGIPQKILPTIFDPYFSTKEEKNGTGLGLYMSKMIVEEHHGGKLIAYNTDKGACFEIVLPKEIGSDEEVR